MNNFFSIKRFARLFRYEVVTNYKFYGLFIAGISLLMMLFLFIDMYTSYSEYRFYRYEPWFFMFFIGMSILGISTAFPATKNKVGLASYLMLPASIFEKYLVQFLVRVVLLIPILLSVFWLDAQIVKSIVIALKDDPQVHIASFTYAELWKIIKPNRVVTLWIMPMWIATAVSLMFALSTFFKGYKLFKVVIAGGVIVALFTASLLLFTYLFFYNYEANRMELELYFYTVTENWSNTEVFSMILFSVLPIILLPLGYFKIKEKQV